jgi:hypothetical protein
MTGKIGKQLMYSLNQLTKFIPLILVCFALHAQAAPNALPAPTPDGCYPGFTTAEGCNALTNLTTGAGNTGVGWYSLFSDGTGSFNTGLGGGTLVLNNADSNTAAGAAALLLNGTGTQNCAFGTDALVFNGEAPATGANFNDAFGAFALFNNSDGFSNNAVGNHSLFENIHGAGNTAVGDLALQDNDTGGPTPTLGNINTAVGASALSANTDGDSNNALGYSALFDNTIGVQNQAIGAFALNNNIDGASNTAAGDSAFAANVNGSFNTVVGWFAGTGVEGSDNIYIGATSGLPGGGTESGHIRIGDPTFVTACFVAGITGVVVTGTPVVVGADGHLGVAAAGSPLSMNEMLKEHRVVQELKATTEKQAARIALQEGQIKALTASLREQAQQIQKVSAQLEIIRPTPRVVENR